MATHRILPLTLIAVATIGTSTMMAAAQETDQMDEAKPIPVQTDARGDHNQRRDRRRHHGGIFGGHGRSEIYTTLFGQVDADNGGSVTQQEVDAYRSAKVAEADASGDGALSIAEFDTLYREFTRSRMVDIFQDFDADGDGVISVEEMDHRFSDAVARMDRDGDGVLTLQRGRR